MPAFAVWVVRVEVVFDVVAHAGVVFDDVFGVVPDNDGEVVVLLDAVFAHGCDGFLRSVAVFFENDCSEFRGEFTDPFEFSQPEWVVGSHLLFVGW